MFFGSGNLVFPIVVGTECANHPWIGSLGLLFTGVVVPFLGVWGMYLYQGDPKQFFGNYGKQASFWFSLIALSLMGPFGVLARCITVAHGSFEIVFPHVSLLQFSAVFCLILFLLILWRNKLMSLLGSILTPLLLVSLVAICFFGLYLSPKVTTQVDVSRLFAIKNGVIQGYQTMDLLAAFFFSTFVLAHIRKEPSLQNNPAKAKKAFLGASLVGASLLGLIYIGLVFLGGKFAPVLEGVAPQRMLGIIAEQTLGRFAAPLVCYTIVLACLTTAVVLAALFADFLRVDICRSKLKPAPAALITLAVAISIASLEFSGIAKILTPILETLYPALIVLTVFNIAHKQWQMARLKWPAIATLASKFLLSFIR